MITVSIGNESVAVQRDVFVGNMGQAIASVAAQGGRSVQQLGRTTSTLG